MTTENKPLTITFPGYMTDEFIERAARLAVEGMRKTVEAKIDERVEATLLKVFTDKVEARAKEIVDKVLADGWGTTDQWGGKGPIISVKEIAIKHLTGPDSHYDRESRISKMVTTAVTKLIDNATSDEITKFRKTIRERFDAVLATKFAETMRDALGLKS